MAERIKLGGLWLNKTRDGREYLTGKLSPSVKILIFKNNFRSADNQPSHIMYLAPVETEEGAAARNAAADTGESFFSSELADAADREADHENDDEPADDHRPAAQQPRAGAPPRPGAPRPAAGAGTGRPSGPPEPPAGRVGKPGAEAAPARRPASPEPDDLSDVEDPFGE